MREFVVLIAFVMLLWSAPCCSESAGGSSDDAAPPDLTRLTQILQKHAGSFLTVVPNHVPEREHYVTCDLSSKMLTVDGKNYGCFSFRTNGDEHQQLNWSFLQVKGMAYWYLVPDQGARRPIFNDFSSDEFVTKDFLLKNAKNTPYVKMARVRLIRQQSMSGTLEKNRRYIMWFGFGHAKPTSITMSINLYIQQASANVSHPARLQIRQNP